MFLRTVPLLSEDSYAKTLIRSIEILLLVQSSVYRGTRDSCSVYERLDYTSTRLSKPGIIFR